MLGGTTEGAPARQAQSGRGSARRGFGGLLYNHYSTGAGLWVRILGASRVGLVNSSKNCPQETASSDLLRTVCLQSALRLALARTFLRFGLSPCLCNGRRRGELLSL